MKSDLIYALIPCAGVGARAGGTLPKQYQLIAGQAMLCHALKAFSACEQVCDTLLVLAPDDQLFEEKVDMTGLRVQVKRCGGASRHASVLNGLRALTEQGVAEDAWVMVHDAARPGLTPSLIAHLIDSVKDDEVGGILALPVPDTLKREQAKSLSSQKRIADTESREGLWQAQTPQMFRLGVLRDALIKAEVEGAVVTDESSALERLGYFPRLVQGSLRNFKVTYPDDFALAEKWLKNDSSD